MYKHKIPSCRKGHSELYQFERKVKPKEAHEVGCQKLKLPNGIEVQEEIKTVAPEYGN